RARGQSATKADVAPLPVSPAMIPAVTTGPASRVLPAVWLGHSGRLRAAIDVQDSLEQALAADSLNQATFTPGLHDVGLKPPEGDAFYVVSLLPYEQKEGASLRGYYIGSWPANATSVVRYAHPAGFIEVTPKNEDTHVSQSFELKDFLTHDQTGVWP